MFEKITTIQQQNTLYMSRPNFGVLIKLIFIIDTKKKNNNKNVEDFFYSLFLFRVFYPNAEDRSHIKKAVQTSQQL